MQRTRTTKTNQRKVTGVKALLYRHQPECSVHVLVHNIDDARGGALHRNAQRVRNWLDRFFSEVLADLHIATQPHFTGQVPQHHVGVGHGRQVTAFVIGRWSRFGTGTFRADAQGTREFRHVSDRAAPGTHGSHVHRGCSHGHIANRCLPP